MPPGGPRRPVNGAVVGVAPFITRIVTFASERQRRGLWTGSTAEPLLPYWRLR